MKKIWYTFLSILILIPSSMGGIIISSYEFSSEMNNISNAPSHSFLLTNSEHSPFNITCNEDFTNQGWPGQGTKENPYLIQGFTITINGVCLGVFNTTKHFIINNCSFLSGPEGYLQGVGILFSNVSNGVVKFSIFQDMEIGLLLLNISKCRITNNLLENCNITEIHSEFMHNCTLANNRVISRRSWNGIYSNGCVDCNIINNTILGYSERSTFGIAVVFTNKSIIKYNTVVNFDYGIQLFGYSLQLVSNYLWACSSGVSIFDSINCRAELNWISDGGCGVEIHESMNCTLIWSVISGNRYGVELEGVQNCSIIENYIVDNWWGLVFKHGHRRYSSGCRIIDNDFRNNGVVFEADVASVWYQEFHGNTVNDKSLGYFCSISDILLNGYEYGQIILVDCKNITLSGGEFYNSSIGITLAFCVGCTVTNIDIKLNTYGILIKHSYNCSLSHNKIEFNNIGIYSMGTRYCVISSNTINNNTYGIAFSVSSYSSIIYNTICYNIDLGIYIRLNSIQNSICGNDLGWNGQNAVDNGENNTWDNGINRGNKWSDYDGFGVYQIPGDADATDNYPLLLTYTASYPPYLLLLIFPIGIIVWISIHHLTKNKSVSSDKGSKIKVPLRYVIISKLKKQKDTIKNRSKSEDEPES